MIKSLVQHHLDLPQRFRVSQTHSGPNKTRHIKSEAIQKASAELQSDSSWSALHHWAPFRAGLHVILLLSWFNKKEKCRFGCWNSLICRSYCRKQTKSHSRKKVLVISVGIRSNRGAWQTGEDLLNLDDLLCNFKFPLKHVKHLLVHAHKTQSCFEIIHKKIIRGKNKKGNLKNTNISS